MISISYNSINLPIGVFKISYSNIEKNNTSEAGTDITNVVRLQKRTFSITYSADSYLLNQLLQITNQPEGIFHYMEEDIPVRARISNSDLLKKSEIVPNTNGLWNVSLQFIEI